MVRFHRALVARLPVTCPALKEVRIVYTQACGQKLGFRGGCKCIFTTLMEFEKLTEEERGKRREALGRTWDYLAAIPRERFEPVWKTNTKLPCPSARCVAICGQSKLWSSLGADEVGRFVAARASEDK
jgi:hypothetical protein